jgi:hypothetical protein
LRFFKINLVRFFFFLTFFFHFLGTTLYAILCKKSRFSKNTGSALVKSVERLNIVFCKPFNSFSKRKVKVFEVFDALVIDGAINL